LKVSDQSPLGSFDQKCFKLAELASHAVDFAKSGEPVNPKLLPKPDSKFKPDFLANQTDDVERDTYPSRNALGLLYRAVPVSLQNEIGPHIVNFVASFSGTPDL